MLIKSMRVNSLLVRNSFIYIPFRYRLTDVNVTQSETTAQKLTRPTTLMETTSTREETTSSFNYGPPSNPSDRGLTGEQTSVQEAIQ